MESFTSVVDAYDAARAGGRSRAEAFRCAVRAYTGSHPALSCSEAGREVARILLHAAAVTRVSEGRFSSVLEAAPRPVISW